MDNAAWVEGWAWIGTSNHQHYFRVQAGEDEIKYFALCDNHSRTGPFIFTAPVYPCNDCKRKRKEEQDGSK